MFDRSSAVHAHELDGEILLFDERSSRLFLNNVTASYIWSQLESGLSVADLTAQLVADAGIPAEQADADITAMLDAWRGHGMLDAAEGSTAEPSPADTELVPEPLLAQADDQSDAVAGHVIEVNMLDLAIRLATDDDLAAECEALIGHLSGPAREGSRRIRLRLENHEDHWRLMHGDRLLDRCDNRGQVIPMLHGQLLMMTYLSSRSTLGIHAACVASGEQAVLLPASSGSGKSTLAAGLAARGLRFLTDDLCVLDGDPMTVRPLPSCVGTKTGSWAPLAPLYPDLYALPVYERYDGQSVRYLPPPRGTLPESGSEWRVTTIVFPRFVAGSDVTVAPVSRGQAIVRIAEAGFDARARLTSDWVGRIVDWVRTTRCFELSFGDLGDGIDAVRGLLE